MKPKTLAPRVLGFVLALSLALPSPVLALRVSQPEHERQLSGLEEALKPEIHTGDPGADPDLVRWVQWLEGNVSPNARAVFDDLSAAYRRHVPNFSSSSSSYYSLISFEESILRTLWEREGRTNQALQIYLARRIFSSDEPVYPRPTWKAEPFKLRIPKQQIPALIEGKMVRLDRVKGAPWALNSTAFRLIPVTGVKVTDLRARLAASAGLEEKSSEKLTWRAWWATMGYWGPARRAIEGVAPQFRSEQSVNLNRLVNHLVEKRINPLPSLIMGIPQVLQTIPVERLSTVWSSSEELVKNGIDPGAVFLSTVPAVTTITSGLPEDLFRLSVQNWMVITGRLVRNALTPVNALHASQDILTMIAPPAVPANKFMPAMTFVGRMTEIKVNLLWGTRLVPAMYKASPTPERFVQNLRNAEVLITQLARKNIMPWADFALLGTPVDDLRAQAASILRYPGGPGGALIAERHLRAVRNGLVIEAIWETFDRMARERSPNQFSIGLTLLSDLSKNSEVDWFQITEPKLTQLVSQAITLVQQQRFAYKIEISRSDDGSEQLIRLVRGDKVLPPGIGWDGASGLEEGVSKVAAALESVLVQGFAQAKALGITVEPGIQVGFDPAYVGRVGSNVRIEGADLVYFGSDGIWVRKGLEVVLFQDDPDVLAGTVISATGLEERTKLTWETWLFTLGQWGPAIRGLKKFSKDDRVHLLGRISGFMNMLVSRFMSARISDYVGSPRLYLWRVIPEFARQSHNRQEMDAYLDILETRVSWDRLGLSGFWIEDLILQNVIPAIVKISPSADDLRSNLLALRPAIDRGRGLTAGDVFLFTYAARLAGSAEEFQHLAQQFQRLEKELSRFYVYSYFRDKVRKNRLLDMVARYSKSTPDFLDNLDALEESAQLRQNPYFLDEIVRTFHRRKRPLNDFRAFIRVYVAKKELLQAARQSLLKETGIGNASSLSPLLWGFFRKQYDAVDFLKVSVSPDQFGQSLEKAVRLYSGAFRELFDRMAEQDLDPGLLWKYDYVLDQAVRYYRNGTSYVVKYVPERGHRGWVIHTSYGDSNTVQQEYYHQEEEYVVDKKGSLTLVPAKNKGRLGESTQQPQSGLEEALLPSQALRFLVDTGKGEAGVMRLLELAVQLRLNKNVPIQAAGVATQEELAQAERELDTPAERELLRARVFTYIPGNGESHQTALEMAKMRVPGLINLHPELVITRMDRSTITWFLQALQGLGVNRFTQRMFDRIESYLTAA